MPRATASSLIWFAEQQTYVKRDPQSSDFMPISSDEEQWPGWLAGRSSFSFQGKQGHLTLRKESRTSKESYWYAYRNQNQRTIKRYAGRTADLTIPQLEELARAITATVPPGRQTPEAAQTSTTALAAPSLPPLLLLAKLRMPHLPNTHVSRPQLISQLDICLERALTVLCAPAGSGKTTLVCQWLASRAGEMTLPPIAWISLDSGDNDPGRFWHMLFTATQTWLNTPGQDILDLLLSSTPPTVSPLTLEHVLTTFLNTITRQNVSGILIVDDYHLITEVQIHTSLSFLISHLPETVHIILLTRHEPPLSLARLRASGNIHEIPATDLRFSLEESATFLQEYSLSTEILEQLDRRIEGWAAGLRLLALALHGQKTQARVEHILATFNGRQRPLLNYFVAEVLEALPEPLQDFLLYTSQLPRLTASLCVAVTGRQESGDLLEQLEHDNLFLEALDEKHEWYRYHPLFAEAMQQQALRLLGAKKIEALAHAASCWFEQQGLLSDAIEAAFQAGTSERAASLLERLILSFFLYGTQEYHTLQRWIEQLPETILYQSPLLCFSYAVVLVFGENPHAPEPKPANRIEMLLAQAENVWQTQNDLPHLGALSAFRAFSAFGQGQQDRSATLARQALAWLPETETIWRGMSLTTLALQALQASRINEARHLLEQIDGLAQIPNNASVRSMAYLFLSIIYFEQGELHRAASYCRKLAQGASLRMEQPTALLATMPLTLILYEWNELDLAEQEIQQALALLLQNMALPQHLVRVTAALQLAYVQHARGKTLLARQHLSTLALEPIGLDNDFSLYLQQEILGWLVRLSLLLDDEQSAQHWLHTLDLCHSHYNLPSSLTLLPPALVNSSTNEDGVHDQAVTPGNHARVPDNLLKQKTLLKARLDLAQGKSELALQTLETLLPEAQQLVRGRHLLQIKLLLARAYVACGKPIQSRHYLLEALAQGYTEGYQRTFLDEGERLMVLLHELLPDLRAEPLRGYVQLLLQQFQRPSSSLAHLALPPAATPLEPLSQQEQRVLRLLAAGLSSAEIASELTVSVNTIRTQLQSIYRKLNVHNRNAARSLARQLDPG